MANKVQVHRDVLEIFCARFSGQRYVFAKSAGAIGGGNRRRLKPPIGWRFEAGGGAITCFDSAVL